MSANTQETSWLPWSYKSWKKVSYRRNHKHFKSIKDCLTQKKTQSAYIKKRSTKSLKLVFLLSVQNTASIWRRRKNFSDLPPFLKYNILLAFIWDKARMNNINGKGPKTGCAKNYSHDPVHDSDSVPTPPHPSPTFFLRIPLNMQMFTKPLLQTYRNLIPVS